MSKSRTGVLTASFGADQAIEARKRASTGDIYIVFAPTDSKLYLARFSFFGLGDVPTGNIGVITVR